MPDLNREEELHTAGHTHVAGIDEAGRGPLAGPVVAAAVILPSGFSHDFLNDSKKLSAKRREALYEELTAHPHVAWACAACSVEEIDTMNILRASHEAMRRAVAHLDPPPDALLVDGLPTGVFHPIPEHAIVGGDAASRSIAAASIIAKVTRDRMMIRWAADFPEYGFDRHKGYGTAYHLQQIERHGPCPLHRQSFRPLAQQTLPLDGT